MSLTQSVSNPLHASAREAYFVLSNDLGLPVNSRELQITGWLVMKFFDWSFASETDAKP